MNDLQKKKIGIIYGGPSSEREISIRSAENIYNALNEKKYNVIKIDLNMEIVENLKKNEIDMAYVILHGSPGEDGSIQGLLDIIDIPYTGSGILGSALAMNKIISKQLLVSNRIPTPDFIIIQDEIPWDNIEQFIYPCLFKPFSEGSSIGIMKFNSFSEIKHELSRLVKVYRHGLIEEFVKGREITVGVIDDAEGSRALPVLELRPKNEIYDYEAKYTKGMTEFICPAELGEKLTEKAKALAVKSHKSLWCQGVSRIDMICRDENLFVLEVNTIPGMTEISDLPAEAAALGIRFEDLVETILISGYNRYVRRKE